MIDIRISAELLSLETSLTVITDSTCGGVASFVGTVRAQNANRKVLHLEFECYEAMALKEMQRIAEDCTEKFKVKNICIHHRIGVVKVGDPAVVIAVNAEHRNGIFDACSYIIDTLKQTVPIWKKEVFEDGSHWVSAYP